MMMALKEFVVCCSALLDAEWLHLFPPCSYTTDIPISPPLQRSTARWPGDIPSPNPYGAVIATAPVSSAIYSNLLIVVVVLLFDNPLHSLRVLRINRSRHR